MRQSNLAVMMIAAAGTMASLVHAGPNLELVIKNTDAVPVIAGAAWATGTSQFQSPSIDSAGNVGFRGTLLTGTGDVTSTNNATMWYGAPGSLGLVARTGTPAPGLVGVNSSGFQSQNLPLSPNGQLWFGGNLSAAPSGYIATGTYSGGLSSVVRNGDTPPGAAAPLNFSPASSSAGNGVNNLGQTIFFGSMSDSTSALWVGGPGSLQKVFHTGQYSPGMLTGSTVRNTAGYSLNGTGGVLTSVSMNLDAGLSIVYGNNEVVATRPWNGSSLNVIAREADPAPGLGAGVFYPSSVFDPGLGFDPTSFTFLQGHLNNSGQALFSSAITGASVTPNVNDAVVFYNDGTSTNPLRRRGDMTSAVPGATLNITSTEANKIRLNNNGEVAWNANLTVAGDVTNSNRAVLLKTSLGSTIDTLIARQGSGIPVVPGALFGTFSNPIMNNAGQIIFSSTMTDDAANPNDNVTTTNDLALFAFDPDLGLSLVAREGDSLASIGLNMTLTGSWLSLFAQANADGGANAFSDNGWLTFRVTGTALAGFTDTAGIVRTRILPTPGSFAILATGFAVALRRRRF